MKGSREVCDCRDAEILESAELGSVVIGCRYTPMRNSYLCAKHNLSNVSGNIDVIWLHRPIIFINNKHGISCNEAYCMCAFREILQLWKFCKQRYMS